MGATYNILLKIHHLQHLVKGTLFFFFTILSFFFSSLQMWNNKYDCHNLVLKPTPFCFIYFCFHDPVDSVLIKAVRQQSSLFLQTMDAVEFA